MDYLSAIWYGAIQGVTEFLPVSSSGHLAILPHFLEIPDPGVIFDLAMHVGTAFSVILYFRKDVMNLLRETFCLAKGDWHRSAEQNYTLNMIVSTVATFVLVLIIKSAAEEYGRTPNLIAFNLFLFGVFMFVADYLAKSNQDKNMNELQVKTALAIGFFQALAIFPGVSRSGATLTISRLLHLTREEATRYSFLLSLPIIIAGFVFKLPEYFQGDRHFDWLLLIIGMGVSFVVGVLTIHFFLKVIKKLGLGIFSVYRLILAAIIVYQVLGS